MILKIVGLALISAFAAFILKGLSWRAAPVFAALCAVVLLSLAGEGLGEILEMLFGFSESANIEEPVRAIVKVIGAGYLFGISADICRELGESGVAKAVEAAGRVEIILLVTPFFSEIINVGIRLVSG